MSVAIPLYDSLQSPARTQLHVVTVTVPGPSSGSNVVREEYHFVGLPQGRYPDGRLPLSVRTENGSLIIEGKGGLLVKAPGTWLEVQSS